MDLSKQITIGLTFWDDFRPESKQRALASIKEHYPDLPLVVQNTKGNLSWGRNRIIDSCETEYVLIMEDDMELTQRTKLEDLLDVLISDWEIGGASGVMCDQLRYPWAHDLEVFRGKLVAKRPSLPIRISRGGVCYQPLQLLPNFYLLRTEVGLEFPWNERLEMMEHREWFFRLREQWRFALVPTAEFLHHSEKWEQNYQDIKRDKTKLQQLEQDLMGVTHGMCYRWVQNNEGRPNIALVGDNEGKITQFLSEHGWFVPNVAKLNAGVHPKMEECCKNWDDHQSRLAINAYKTTPWAMRIPEDFVFSKWLQHLNRFEPVLLNCTSDCNLDLHLNWPWKKSCLQG